MRVCSVDGCETKHIAKGYCFRHYNWYIRHPDKDFRISLDDEKRFYSYVELIPFSECWWWTGNLSRQGYGSFYVNKKTLGAHRYSYTLNKGPIDEGLFVCHSCDNPMCVNPDHLWLGTPLDNARDAMTKGRICMGERAPKAKLTGEIVKRMRDMHYIDGVKQNVLAEMFGVSNPVAHYAITGKTWKHIKG